MPEYYNVTTNLGDAEIANAIATNTKLNITHIAFGDGNGSVPTPDKARTSLVREVHRQAVTKYERHATNANWIVIETIIPSSIGGFWVREMGIIANGKLISHGSHAPFEKVADPTGVSEYRLKFTQNIKDGNVVNITLDQSLIYASQAWTDENYVPRDEIIDNLTTDDALKPVSAKQAKKLQDNKLDKTANAASATKLATARSIGGVNFDGTANINLPGVDVAGNQSTSGNAASATKLQTARTIAILGAVTGTATSFDGSANVAITTTSLDATKLSGTASIATTGNAASATKLATARSIGGVNFDGTANINLPGVNVAGNQSTSGNAASATKLATALGGAPSYSARATVNFNGANGAIRNGQNIASVTRTAGGTYQINFINQMPTDNYAIVSSLSARGDAASLNIISQNSWNCTVRANYGGDNTVGSFDPAICCISIFC